MTCQYFRCIFAVYVFMKRLRLRKLFYLKHEIAVFLKRTDFRFHDASFVLGLLSTARINSLFKTCFSNSKISFIFQPLPVFAFNDLTAILHKKSLISQHILNQIQCLFTVSFYFMVMIIRSNIFQRTRLSVLNIIHNSVTFLRDVMLISASICP